MENKTSRLLLFLVRHNNDFERVAALADILNESHHLVIIDISEPHHIKNNNSTLIQLVKNAGIRLLEISDLFPVLGLALRFQGLPLKWFMRIFRTASVVNSLLHPRIGKTILNKFKPDLLLMDYVQQNNPFNFLKEIHASAVENNIPIVGFQSGIGSVLPKVSHPNEDTRRSSEKMLHYDYLTAPNEIELAQQILPNVGSTYREALVLGDPRYSPVFLKKLQLPSSDRRSYVVLGGNFTHMGLDFSQQDEITLRIVDKLNALSNNLSINVKFHPRVPRSPIREKIASRRNVEIAQSTVNSSELLNSCVALITPPTSIIFEAALLGINVVLIDPFDNDIIRTYDDIGFKTLALKEIEQLSEALINQPTNYNMRALQRIACGGHEGDCRRLYAELINRILSPT